MSYLERKRNAMMSVTNTVRGYLRTTSGEPPLTLTNTYPDKLKIKLYGKSTQASGTYYTANHTITATECNYTTRKLWFPPSSSGYVGDFYVYDGFAYWCFTLDYDCDTTSSEYYIDCLREGIYEVDYNNIETQRVTVTQWSTIPSGYTDFSSNITSRTGNVYLFGGTPCSFGAVNGKYANFTPLVNLVSGTVLEYDSYTPSLKYTKKRFLFDISYEGYTGNFYIQDGSYYFVFTLNNAFTNNTLIYYLDTVDGKIYSEVWENYGNGNRTVICEASRITTLPTGANAPTDFSENVYDTNSTEESITITTSTTASYTVLSAQNIVSHSYPDTTHQQTITSPTTGGVVRGKNLFTDFTTDATYANGSTVRVNADKSITVHKVAGDTVRQSAMVNLPAGNYTLSNGLTTGSLVYIQIYSSPEVTTKSNPIRTFSWSGGLIEFLLYSLVSDVTDVTLYPQVEQGSTATPYEPYQSTDIVITKDGQPVKLYGLPVTSGGNITIGSQQYLSDVVTDNGDGTGTLEKNYLEIVMDGVTTNKKFDFKNADYGDYKSFFMLKSGLQWISGTSINQCLCSHFSLYAWGNGIILGNYWWYAGTSTGMRLHKENMPNYNSLTTDEQRIAAANAWLNDKFVSGNPVTIIYRLSTPTYQPVTITKNKAVNGTTIITSDCPYIGAEYYSWEES